MSGPISRQRAEPPSRQRASVGAGLRAEWLAILFLSAKGYRLLARRHGGKGGEIDLIMRRGRTVIFVEVKARGRMETAMEAITPAKIRLITRRVGIWRAQNPWSQGCTLRADALFLAPRRWPAHVPNVFELPLA